MYYIIIIVIISEGFRRSALKVKLVPPSFPRASYISFSFYYSACLSILCLSFLVGVAATFVDTIPFPEQCSALIKLLLMQSLE